MADVMDEGTSNFLFYCFYNYSLTENTSRETIEYFSRGTRVIHLGFNFNRTYFILNVFLVACVACPPHFRKMPGVLCV